MLRSSLRAAAVLFVIATPQVSEAGRYVFGDGVEKESFVLDAETGRVWRYDRADDAWYLYDLEALTPARTKSPTIDQSPSAERLAAPGHEDKKE